MKIHRFIGDFDLSKKEVEITNPENIKQIKDVLRLKIGEKIILADGKGKSAEATITSLSKNKIEVTLEKMGAEDKPSRIVNLYLAILKKENFELAVQKAVEVGVSSITPVITERTIKTGLNMERLQKIILEASEQCGRNTLPEVFDIFPFEEAIDSAADQKIIFHIDDGIQEFKPDLKAQSINIFVGPEGGFTEKEILIAKEHGYSLASLGPLTLTGVTAAIVATYRAVSGI